MSTLSLHNVTKYYGDLCAVHDLSFEVKKGEIFGLLGPNGAGKTTTIRMIMRIILPDTGTIQIMGQSNHSDVLDRVGYLPEERGLYRKMKVHQLLAFFAELKNVPRQQIPSRIHYWLDRMDLMEWRDRKVEELSRGMQQKLQFIVAMLHEPELIILDEPFAGLDPVNTDIVKEILLEEKEKGKSIILSTHLMEQVEKICDSICLINKGQKVLGGDLKEVKRRYGRNNVVIEYRGKPKFLGNKSLVQNYNDYGNYVEIQLKEGVNPQSLLQRAIEDVEVFRFELVEPSLHEIFVETVKEG